MLGYLKRLFKAISSMRIEVRLGGKSADENQIPKRIHPQAQFEIIGLDAVRREYIAHWPSIHQRVHQIVQMIIRQNLFPGEDFRLVARDSYAISFHRDSEAAHRCANNIRAAVMDLFIFDLKIKNIGLQVSVHNSEEEERLVPEEASRAAPQPPVKKDKRIAAKRGGSSVVQKSAPAKMPAPASPAATHLASPSDPLWRHHGHARPLLLRDDDGNAVLPHGLEIVFSPIVALADNSRTCFAVFARLHMGGHVLYGYDVLPEEADDDMILDLDIRTVTRICQVMEKMEKIHGYPSKMLCPVHYRTVADDVRYASFLRAFEQLQKRGYDRFVAIQLHHMPRALYGNELSQPIQALSRLSSRVVVMVPLDWTSTGELSDAGARAIGVDFQEFADMPPEAAHAKMRAFVKQVNREKLQSYVFAVTGVLKELAEGVGFSHLCDCEVIPQLRNSAASGVPAAELVDAG